MVCGQTDVGSKFKFASNASGFLPRLSAASSETGTREMHYLWMLMETVGNLW